MRLFALLMLVALPAFLSAQSIAIKAVDPPREGAYPGSRGPDELIIYTPTYGHESTGTNQYGTEAVVRDNVVRSVGGNNTPIPADGYVISGHGDSSRWVNEHLYPGVAVAHDGKTLRIDDSPDARVRSLLARLDMLEAQLGERPEDRELMKTTAKLRVQVEQAATTATLERIDGIARRVIKAENQLWRNGLRNFPSPDGEVRAVWHRLTETTPEQIAALAEQLKQAGVNVIFPETIYASQAIYNDPTGLYPKFPQYGEHDALAILIEECHKRGIQVHAWVHVFFIGIKDSTDEPPLLAEKHPEWLARDRQGRTASAVETNYMFINPAHPAAHAAIINAYRELAKNYNIDGFQFDYIRYCSYTDWQDDWDYSDHTRQRVREELKFDPLEINPEANPEQWARWRQWRQDVISNFVRDASAALREANPKLILSADIFSDQKDAAAVKGQDWAGWAEKDYIDAIIPMAYFTSSGDVKRAIQAVKKVLPEKTTLVAGLPPFLHLTQEQVVDQIKASREAGADGQAMFNWISMDESVRSSLALGPWRNFSEARWDHRPTTH